MNLWKINVESRCRLYFCFVVSFSLQHANIKMERATKSAWQNLIKKKWNFLLILDVFNMTHSPHAFHKHSAYISTLRKLQFYIFAQHCFIYFYLFMLTIPHLRIQISKSAKLFRSALSLSIHKRNFDLFLCCICVPNECVFAIPLIFI